MFKRYHQLIIVCVVLGLTACSTTPSKNESADPGFNNQLFQKAKSSYLAGDFKTAATLFDSLAQNGNPEAQYSLGYMYYYSKGVDRDLDKAMYWFKLAASQGNPNAKQALLTINKRIAEQKHADNPASTSTANTSPGAIDLRPQITTQTNPAPVSAKPELDKMITAQPTPAPVTPAPVQQAKKITPTTASLPAVKQNDESPPVTEQERTSKVWIMKQPANHYTIQMLSSSQEANAQRLQKKLSTANTHYFRAKVKDQLRFSVIAGSYENYAAARQQQQTFKKQGYRDTWIRSIEGIQKIIK
jgi:TPR repeat protein